MMLSSLDVLRACVIWLWFLFLCRWESLGGVTGIIVCGV